jgi:DNA-binding MarR family transcriptional regulator
MAKAKRREALSDEDMGHGRIILSLLDSVERDSETSQRRLAADLGVAVGLVNAYLKRCIKKGLIKASQAPARRYVYYLTPQGFIEKSRLTVEFLSYSFGFFRQAKLDCSAILGELKANGYSHVVLAGKSDLAEIVTICGLEFGLKMKALVDPDTTDKRFLDLPVFASFDQVPGPIDAVIVTDLKSPQEVSEHAVRRFGVSRILVPQLLRVRLSAVEVRP